MQILKLPQDRDQRLRVLAVCQRLAALPEWAIFRDMILGLNLAAADEDLRRCPDLTAPAASTRQGHGQALESLLNLMRDARPVAERLARGQRTPNADRNADQGVTP